MSKFWQKKYISEYTGAEIDAAVAKAGELTKVTANPTLAGTEAALTGLEVGDTKYKVEQPINVVANPTLAGTEAALEGLQVGNTKYKIDAGGATKVTVNVSPDPDDPTSFVATTSMYSVAIVAAAATGIVTLDIVMDASIGGGEIIQTAFFVQPGDDDPPTPSIIASGSITLLGVNATYSLIITSGNALFSISM